MDRRKFLRAASSAAGLGFAGPLARGALAADGVAGSAAIRRVAIIGAGIIGASIAYNLSKRGCDVIVIEKEAPAAQASGNSFAWINASYFDTPLAYLALRTFSLNEYHRLAEDVEIPIRWSGSLEWYKSDDRQAEVIKGIRRMQNTGAPMWILDKDEVARIEPNLVIGADRMVAYSTRDGAVDPGGTTRALLERVRQHGGTLIYPAEVTELHQQRNGMRVVSDVETFDVDLVVVATGVGTSNIASLINLNINPMRATTPGVIVTTEPTEMILNTVMYTSDVHFHQRTDGRIVLGEKTGAPQTDQHATYLSGRPNAYPTAELANEHAARVLELAAHYVPQLATAKVESVGVGWRPLPLDGLPVIGRPKGMPGVYLAAMHSGVTLAPAIGHLAAMEILDGIRVELLSDYRYERFLAD